MASEGEMGVSSHCRAHHSERTSSTESVSVSSDIVVLPVSVSDVLSALEQFLCRHERHLIRLLLLVIGGAQRLVHQLELGIALLQILHAKLSRDDLQIANRIHAALNVLDLLVLETAAHWKRGAGEEQEEKRSEQSASKESHEGGSSLACGGVSPRRSDRGR